MTGKRNVNVKFCQHPKWKICSWLLECRETPFFCKAEGMYSALSASESCTGHDGTIYNMSWSVLGFPPTEDSSSTSSSKKKQEWPRWHEKEQQQQSPSPCLDRNHWNRAYTSQNVVQQDDDDVFVVRRDGTCPHHVHGDNHGARSNWLQSIMSAAFCRARRVVWRVRTKSRWMWRFNWTFGQALCGVVNSPH